MGKAICLNKGRDGKVHYRCKLCNNINGRIYRAKGKVQWESQEARKHFFQQNNTLSGKELRKEQNNTLSGKDLPSRGGCQGLACHVN